MIVEMNFENALKYKLFYSKWDIICFIIHLCVLFSPPVLGVGAAVIDNYLYVVGGHSGSSYLNTVQKYDPISDTWLDSAGMIYCRCNFGLTALWEVWTCGNRTWWCHGKKAQCPENCIAFSVTWSGVKTQSFVGYFEQTNSLNCSWLYSKTIIKKKKERKGKKRKDLTN